MPKYMIIVSNPKTRKAEAKVVEGNQAVPFLGRKINEVMNGSIIGFPSNDIIITGGSDRDGFPMRWDVHGGVKTKILLHDGPGFKPSRKGERKRKTVRGNIITDDIVQINVKVTEREKNKEPLEKASKE